MAMSPRLLRPVASSGFRPSQLADLACWLDASNSSSLTLNSGNVSEWRDLSGNARHYAQTDAALQPSTARTQNNRTVLDFNGSTHGLVGNAAANGIARNVAGLTILMAAKYDAITGTGAGGHFLWFASRNDNAGSARLVLGTLNSFSPANGFGLGGRRLDADSFSTTASASNTAAHVFGGVADYTNTVARLFVDGANTASNTSWLTTGSTPDNNSLATSIGFVSPSTQNIDGFIAEVIVYRRVLSAAERQRVERYLGLKWGITVA